MQLSPAGFVLCALVLALGCLARGPLIVSLLASLAFGSTALMTLTSLGGSSPLIYTLFAALLVAIVATRRRIWRDLGNVFGSMRPIWVLCALMLYVVVGAMLLPRLFAGQASVFVQSATRTGIVESPLAPVTGNISQTGYMLMGGLTAIALCVLLQREERFDQVRRGFFIGCVLHAGMGVLDLLGKLAGAGDVLAPIRTATYAMLTDVSLSGFVRIAGAYSESSAFGAASLACLAFSYVYWRETGDRLAKWLAVVLLGLVLLSTSSTAYVGLVLLGTAVLFSIARSLVAGRLSSVEFLLLLLLTGLVFVGMAVGLANESAFDPVVELIDSTVINKMGTNSGRERTYWNVKSLQSLVDTGGLGVGLGSSRASSWPVAVVSQLGLGGAILMALLLTVIARGLGRLRRFVDPETGAIVASVRASALAGVVAGSLINGTADPGMGFFVALAVIAASRAHARRNRRALAGRPFAGASAPWPELDGGGVTASIGKVAPTPI